MKKLVLGSVLALSSSLAMVGCTQANAVSESQTKPTTQMQQKAQFQKGKHHKGKRGGFENLNLSAEQEAQIQALRQAQNQKRQVYSQQHRAQMQQLQAQTEALINSPTLNNAALNKLAEQQAAISKQRFIQRVQSQHAMAQVLTEEQKAELKKMREERGGKSRGQGRADRGEGRPGDRGNQMGGFQP